MEGNKNKVIALVGDFLDDAENVKILEKRLNELCDKCRYYKDVDDNMLLVSVVLILNEKSLYASDANSFIHYAITNRIPIIVVYTEIENNREIHDSISFTERATKLWTKIPAFAKERYMVATVHISFSDLKQIIRSNDFIKGTMLYPSDYYLLKSVAD